MNTNDHLIDDLLSSFFKAELPKQWPALKLAATDVRADMPIPMSLMPTTQQERVTPNKSRMALAVSAALILGSFWYLSDRFEPTPTRPGVGLKDTQAKNPLAPKEEPQPIMLPMMP